MEVLDRHPRDRDSHDLSFTLSRFSVVDSMLSSLSDIPSGTSTAHASAHNSQIYSNYDTNDIYTAAPKLSSSNTTTTAGRRRGHTQSSSMSDYDVHVDDIASRYNQYHSRGRQNVTYHKPKSTRNGSIRSGTSGARDNAPAASESARHTRGTGMNTKGSNSSSVDLGATNTVPSTRFTGHAPSRAASFDHSYGERVPRSSPEKLLANSRPAQPVPVDYLAFDAAPMPTIPGGPRRADEPISPVGYPMTPKKSAPSRKNSVKSTAAKSIRKSKSSAPIHDHDIRDQAKQFVHATNTMRSGGGAPSPTVGTLRKAYPSSTIPPHAPKEQRPGFFRRVFGSSKNSDKQTHHEEIHRPPSPAAVRQMPGTSSGNRPRTQPSQQHSSTAQNTAASLSSQSRPPTQGDDQPPPLPLRKAHSSFFRRRKKSLSDNVLPPVPPLQLPAQPSYHHAQLNIAPPQRSPSHQSLRGAMAQYLSDKPGSGVTSPIDTFFDSREHQPANEGEEAPVRHLSSTSLQRDVPGRTPGSLRQGTNQDVPKREGGGDNPGTVQHQDRELVPPSNMRPRPRQGFAGDLEGGSFLINSSSNEAVSQPSPTDIESHRLLQRQHSSPGPDAFGRPLSNKENVTPPRRANIGEKRADVHILSPISDHSHRSDHEQTSRFFEADDEDEQFVIKSAKAKEDSSLNSASGNNRVWLEPTSSDEKLDETARLRLPLEGPRTSTHTLPTMGPLSPNSDGDTFVSASSLPIVQIESKELRMSQEWANSDTTKALLAEDTEPTQGDKVRARQIFDGDEEFVSKAGAAAWLGQTTPKSSRTRRAYMDLFDWNAVNILAAFRELCGKLLVKAESQQLDRVIDAFSERWCNCNPNHGFKDRDVIHTITFSILMLNTDLHIADLDQRMTRSQFVKNTLPTIKSMAEAVEMDAAETIRTHTQDIRGKIPWDHSISSPSSPVFPDSAAAEDRERRPSLDIKKSNNRMSFRGPIRSDSDGPADSTDNCNVLVKAPFEGSMKGWEFQVEIVLKEFYNSIRQQRLPLHGAPTAQTQGQASSNGLSVVTNALRRTPSVLSKAPSDTISYRGRSSEAGRFHTGRFTSKTRSRPRVYPSSTVGSSRTSLDDTSVWSPSGSTWSKYTLGKTQTSTMSVDSLGSHFAHGDYQQAIGFANALSQAIIREEGAAVPPGSDEFHGRVVPLLEDETLELVGAPWAKEGMLKHKHHLETLEKKAKDRNWSECFAVIEKGWMKIFSFSTTSKSLRARAKSRAASGGGPVGGGNWTENAEQINQFLLRQTIASALPPPGYSKSRPNVWALSLPTGAVHLFQVGTPDIVKEFVSTANYWSARLSKEPLIGGVSNIEYGWGDSIINSSLLQQRPDSAATTSAPGTSSSSHPVTLHSARQSVVSQAPSGMASIGRRSEDQGPGISWKTRLPGDRATISDWTPPTQSMMASQLMEVDQLRALTAYVSNVEEELKIHNDYRPLMGMAFSPRHPNASKAMANWEKKSAYLLREIVKFRTYIDSLTAAQIAKDKYYDEREELIQKGSTPVQVTTQRDNRQRKSRTRTMKRSILDWNSLFRVGTPRIFEEEERDNDDFDMYLRRLGEMGQVCPKPAYRVCFDKLDKLGNESRDKLDGRYMRTPRGESAPLERIIGQGSLNMSVPDRLLMKKKSNALG